MDYILLRNRVPRKIKPKISMPLKSCEHDHLDLIIEEYADLKLISGQLFKESAFDMDLSTEPNHNIEFILDEEKQDAVNTRRAQNILFQDLRKT